MRTFPRLSNWKRSKCSLFLKTKKEELDSTILAWKNWIVTLWKWISLWDQNSLPGLQKNKALFRQKLSTSFQFWDTKYSVIKTFDLTLKIFSFYLHSFPGSLHFRFLVKRRSWEQFVVLSEENKYQYHSLLSAFVFACSSSCCQLLSMNT